MGQGQEDGNTKNRAMNVYPGKTFKKKDTSDYVPAVVAGLFRLLKIPATITRIKEILKSHPDFPSLLSINESLPEWGVRTEAIKSSAADLSEADYPGIAHLKSNELVVLEEITDGRVRFWDPSRGRRVCTVDAFSEIWSGIILKVFPEPDAGEIDYRVHRRGEIFSALRAILVVPGLTLSAILAFVYGLSQVENPGTLPVLWIIKLVGFFLCVILTLSSIADDRILQNLCPSGKRSNCLRVLTSPAGKIFNIPMAEIGLLYFSGGLLTSVIMLYTNHVELSLFLLAVLNVLTLPYTFFSLIYQAFVVHSWCWMCIVIQVLFWIEFYIQFNSWGVGISGLEWPQSLSFILGFSIPIFSWIGLRSLFVRVRRSDYLHEELLRYRHNPGFIQIQLDNVEKIDMGNFPDEIEIGPSDAEISLYLVVNPICAACGKAFRQLVQLIRLGHGHIKGSIRFLLWIEDKDKSAKEKRITFEVALLIISLSRSGNREILQDALRDWFSPGRLSLKKKFKKLQEKYPSLDNRAKEIAEISLRSHNEWAKSAAIMNTPAIFFNGKTLPPESQLEDLKYFLLSLIDC